MAPPRAFPCATAVCAKRSRSIAAHTWLAMCDTGVAMRQVDRVADLDLMSERFAALAPGDVIEVALTCLPIATMICGGQDGSRTRRRHPRVAALHCSCRGRQHGAASGSFSARPGFF